MICSIIIPTFNNFHYLKLTIDSIKRNSNYNHEIIVHVNEGLDDTLSFLTKNNIVYTFSPKNLGLCSSTNIASKKATTDFILYSHDDMYYCPGWDLALEKEVNNLKHNLYYFSSTMIEQKSGHIAFDCGSTYENFNESKLLENYNKLDYYDYQGSHWAPHLIHRTLWEEINGFSQEFDPGIGSDPDLNMKLWKAGVRIFKGLNKFKVYHFGSISLRKKPELRVNKGTNTFLKKWGITPVFFTKHYLKGGLFSDNTIRTMPYSGPLNEPKINLSYVMGKIICGLKFLKLMILNK